MSKQALSPEGAALIIGGDRIATEAIERKARWCLQAEGLPAGLAHRLATGQGGWHKATQWAALQGGGVMDILDLWRWALHILEGGRFAPFGVERAHAVLLQVEGWNVPVAAGHQSLVHAGRTWALWERLALAD